MKTIKEILFDSQNYLLNYKIEEAKSISEFIVSAICEIKRNELILNYEKTLNINQIKKIEKYIKDVSKGKPLSWVLKSHNFNGIDIYIDNGIFVPRPETEELANMVFEKSREIKNPIILDFCAGSGAIGLYIASKNKNATVYAIDKSKKAYNVMIKNKSLFKLDNFFPFRSSKINIFDFKFDIVVSNPPYVPEFMYDTLPLNVKVEPKSAVVAGDDGLSMVRYILSKIDIIKNGGFLFLEIGEYYTNKVEKLFSKFFKRFEILKDVNGKDRFVFAIKE